VQAQGSINQTYFQLKLGAKDNSFIHMVSFLAKWLFTIKTWPSSSSDSCIHSIIQRFMQKSLPNVSRFSHNYDHTLTGLQLTHSFTINLTNRLTFSVIIPISCSFSSNDCILVQDKRSMHSTSLNSYNCFIQFNQKHLISHQKSNH